MLRHTKVATLHRLRSNFAASAQKIWERNCNIISDFTQKYSEMRCKNNVQKFLAFERNFWPPITILILLY